MKKNFWLFIIAGSVAALGVEFHFNFLATHNPANFVFTLFFYPLYLSLVYLASRWFDRHIKNYWADIIYYLLFGLIGLSFEWFVIGNSPWGNPEAVQSGMWAFWVAVALIPRIIINPAFPVKRLKKGIVWTLGVYLVGTTGLGLMLPPDYRLFWIVMIHMAFYFFLHYFYLRYLWLRIKRQA